MISNCWSKGRLKYIKYLQQFIPVDVYVPVEALIGIYARESGHGLLFAESDEPTPSDTAGSAGDGGGRKARRPTLKVIK